MKRCERKRSTVFRKYLLSYAVAFFLPLLCASVFLYSYVIRIFQNEVIQNAYNKLHQTMISADLHIQQIGKIADSLYMDPKFLPFDLAEHTVAGIEAIASLKTYALSDTFLSEIIFYPGEGEYLISSSTSYTIDNFFYRYRYSNWDPESFMEDMKANIPMVRPSEAVGIYSAPFIQASRKVTFLFPDPNSYLQRKVIITVDANAFQAFHPGTETGGAAATYLLDQNMNLIVCSDPSIQADALIGQVNFSESQELQTIVVNGEPFMCMYVRSPETRWTYLVTVNSEIALKAVKDLRLLIACGAMLLLVLGLAVIVFLAHHSYAPVRGLRRRVEAFPGESGSDEFTMIHRALSALQNKNQLLSDQLDNSADAVKNYLIYNLLKGTIASREAFNAEGKAFGMTLDQDAFRVIIFYSMARDQDLAAKLSSFSERLEALLPKGMQGYTRDYTELNSLVLVVCYDRQEQPALHEFLLACKEECKALLRHSITIGVSDGATDIAQIPKLYIQAITATDYRLLKGIDHIIYYEELAVNQSSLDNSFLKIGERLASLMRRNENEQILNLLHNTIRYMKSSNTSIFVAKMVCYDIISTMIKAIDEIGIERRISPSGYPNIFLISSFETVDDLISIVNKIIMDVSRCFREGKGEGGEEGKAGSFGQMVSYIEKHYADVDFSILQMADTFHMSAPNISAYFKKNAGITLLEYVTRLKIARAKELLGQSNMLLRDIALEVGYYNPTSFIRRFKQQTGMTPGEYRNQCG